MQDKPKQESADVEWARKSLENGQSVKLDADATRKLEETLARPPKATSALRKLMQRGA